MVKMSEGAKDRVSFLIGTSKTLFHYGFIPCVIYLGFRKGADAGMPELTLMHLLWA